MNTSKPTVLPRVVVADAAAAVAFFRTVLGATGTLPEHGPAELRIGDSVLLVSQAGERDRFPAFLYVYVADVDRAHAAALAAGAESVEAPADTPYGERRAMVRDPSGNLLQLARRD